MSKPNCRSGASTADRGRPRLEELEPREAPAFPAAINLGALTGTDGFALNGIATGDRAGVSVSGMGDVNGDGLDDFIVGASRADLGGTDKGQAYVIFGRGTGFPSSINLGNLDGSNGFALNGVADSDLAGISVSGAGDVNGDGLDDVIVGAPYTDAGGTRKGQAYVVFGRAPGFPATINLGSLTGTDGFALNGATDNASAGLSVSGAGDINGDGLDDVIIGAERAKVGMITPGQAYVVFGRVTGFPASIDLGTLDGSNGFALNGAYSGDEVGHSVSGAGDINGDGLDDVIVGAPYADAGGSAFDDKGQAYVVFGRNTGFPASIDLGTLDGSNGFTLNGISNGDYAGTSVSGAGDINGDGLNDLIVGAPYPNAGGLTRGQAYVVFGRGQPFPAQIDLGSLDGTNGFTLNGIEDNDYVGTSVSRLRDVNGNGFSDLIVGGPYADLGSVNKGQAYVVFGGEAPFPAQLDLETLNGTNGFTLNGSEVGGTAGYSVSDLGDINGDGIADLIIGAPGANRAYVVFGQDGFGPEAELTNAPEVTVASNPTAYTFSVVYRDVIAVSRPSLGNTDMQVVTPGGVLLAATLVAVDPDETARTLAATYQITPPGGNWDQADNGIYTVRLVAGEVTDTSGNIAPAGDLGTFTVNVTSMPPVGGVSRFAVGAGAGGPSQVTVYNPDQTEAFTFEPFPDFTGGVRVAVADVNGDGVADLIAGTGPGATTSVRVIDGKTQSELFSIQPFESSFTGGVFVAAGDINGDGKADLAISPDEGGGPRVRLFSGDGFGQLNDFFGIEDPAFRGGARIAFGDLSADGMADLLVVAGFGGGPRIAGFDGVSVASGVASPVKLFADFFVFEQTLRNGVFIASGDVNGDGSWDVIAGGGPGGGPRVFGLSGSELVASDGTDQVQIANFFAGEVENRGGIRLSAKDLDADGKADLVVGDGEGAGSRVTAYAGSTIPTDGSPPELFAFDAFEEFSNGVFVG